MSFDADAHFAAWKTAFATRETARVNNVAAIATALGTYKAADALANCNASKAAAAAIHTAFLANGGRDAATPGC